MWEGALIGGTVKDVPSIARLCLPQIPSAARGGKTEHYRTWQMQTEIQVTHREDQMAGKKIQMDAQTASSFRAAAQISAVFFGRTTVILLRSGCAPLVTVV